MELLLHHYFVVLSTGSPSRRESPSSRGGRDATSPVYLPICASPFTWQTARNMLCAFSWFSGFPPQVFRTDDCKARAKEKDTFQGASGMYSAIAWMCCVASSSDWPPDKKVMPAIVGGTVSFITSSVYFATFSAGSFFGASAPGTIIAGLKSMPSIITPYCWRTSYCIFQTLRVTSLHVSMSWSPSNDTSGSTIGTKPSLWQVAAYCARVVTQSRMAASVGVLSVM